MDFEIGGRVAVVTGAGSGLGRAIATLFSSQGASVVVSDRDAKGGGDTVAELRGAGGSAEFVAADVAREKDVVQLMEAAVDAYGGIDFAVNNAAVEGPKKFMADYSLDEWTNVVSVNLTGVFLCMKYEIPHMRERGGSIVNVASTAALGGSPSLPAYTATKHGILGLTKAAALAYAPDGIRINAICPGSFRTPMSERIFGDEIEEYNTSVTPLGRQGTLEEIASTVVYLCSSGAAFITGTSISIDGGKRAR